MDIVDIVNKKQEKFIKDRSRHIKTDALSKVGLFDKDFYFWEGDNVAQIVTGGYNSSDLYFMFSIREAIGKEGKINLIHRTSESLYAIAKSILDGNLKESEEHYLTKSGIKEINEMLNQANISVYLQDIPPFPKGIKNDSLDAILTLDTVRTLIRLEGKIPIMDRTLPQIYKKLSPHDGDLIFHSELIEDIACVVQNALRIGAANKMYMTPEIPGFGLIDKIMRARDNFYKILNNPGERDKDSNYPAFPGSASGYFSILTKDEDS